MSVAVGARPRGLTLAVLAAVLSIGACGVSGLAFREDTRVEILAPGDRDEVVLPLDVRWSVRDFDGTFAVLVDRPPQPPGQPLGWFARNDDQCQVAPGCPDEAYLAERGIFTTRDTEITIERLSAPGEGRRDLHEITIVLLDGDGRRIGESAWSVEFEADREVSVP